MKPIVRFLIVIMFVACSSRSEKITETITPFMITNFPNASFEVIEIENLNKLVIRNKDKTIKNNHFDSLMTETLGTFYLNFYKSDPSAETDSEFSVSYYSTNFFWESKTYNLLELSELYNIIPEKE